MNILISIAAFVVAIGILVTVHEFGHFWVARRLGVKVLRFSVGFGKPLYKRTAGKDRTEYVVAAIPLGGYVKMLDEREGEVDALDLPRAFNRQSVAKRFAIVSAGPLFNFLLAIVTYGLMFTLGVSGIKPVVGDIAQDSLAAASGMKSGDLIISVNGKATPTWEAATIGLVEQALVTGEVMVQATSSRQAGETRNYTLDLRDTRRLLDEGSLLDKIGITPWRPDVPAVIGELIEDGAAQRGGLKTGDKILSANEQAMNSWDEWVAFIRAHPGESVALKIQRGSNITDFSLITDSKQDNGAAIGQIGAYAYVSESDRQAYAEQRVLTSYYPIEAFVKGLQKTWDMSELTVRVLWKLVTGEASVKNISGPVTIAEYAGISAQLGISTFLGALALFSISIGILNLLPIPMLDGGHLLYYLVEIIKGSPVSGITEAIGQRIGMAMLAGLMCLAFYNDFLRLFG